MATNQHQTLKKLMQPKNSKEAEAFLIELSGMLDSMKEDLAMLLETKEEVLSSLDDKKIDKFFDQERELDKNNQIIEHSKQRLQKTLGELKVKEDKSKAEPIREKATQAQQRGVEIYNQYSEYAKAIQSLIEELKRINTQIGLANQQCCELDEDHINIDLPVREFARLNNIFSPVDLTKKSAKSAIRLPVVGEHGRFHVNHLDLSQYFQSNQSPIQGG